MKSLLIVAALVMSTGTFAAGKEVVNPDCQKMAQNAKGFATLRQTGLATTPEQFASFVVTPVVQSYPIKAILQYVFDQKDQTPDQVYASLYGRCTLMGYSELYSYFQDRESTEKVQAELNIVKAQLEEALVENRKLTESYSSMRAQLVSVQSRGVRNISIPPAVKSYGTPISEPIAAAKQ